MVSFESSTASGETPHDIMTKTPHPNKKQKLTDVVNTGAIDQECDYETPKNDNAKVRGGFHGKLTAIVMII